MEKEEVHSKANHALVFRKRKKGGEIWKMPVIKKKMSTSAYVLIALMIVAVVSLPILHITGILDLSFIGIGFNDIMTWAATDTLNGALLISGTFVSGALFFYIAKTYLLGTQIPITTQPYTPMGQTISPQQQPQEETVVSE